VGGFRCTGDLARVCDRCDDQRIDLSTATSRLPLTEVAEAFSGATLERLEVPDGGRLVLKRLPAEGDWLTRSTDGPGRLRRLWEAGVFDRIEPVVDHTIIDVLSEAGQDVVVMRDASDDLLPPRVPVSRETVRVLLGKLAGLHDAGTDEACDGLCAIGSRYAMFAPAFHAGDAGAGRHPLADRIATGWELFAEHVDPDVAAAVFAVHRDPQGFGARFQRFPSTLLHGDAKLENLGLSDDRLVAIDWGDMTGFGPREIDVGWFALKGSIRAGCAPDELFADYAAASGRPLDPDALDLVCIGSLAQMGFRMAVGAYASGPEPPEVAGPQLEWWTARVAAALEAIGPI
jgi:hypothetical protein